jgi:hypothetical protein
MLLLTQCAKNRSAKRRRPQAARYGKNFRDICQASVVRVVRHGIIGQPVQEMRRRLSVIENTLWCNLSPPEISSCEEAAWTSDIIGVSSH